MSVPLLHPASHRGSRAELVMHNPNSAQVVTGPLIEWGWPGWHGPGTYQVPDGMGIVLWRGAAYAGSNSSGWKGVAGRFPLDSEQLLELPGVHFSLRRGGLLCHNPNAAVTGPNA